MATDDDPAELLRRATALRVLSFRLGLSSARWLCLRAGADTWIGPTATSCVDELHGVRRTIERAMDDLAAAADRLEIRADTLAGSGGATAMRVQ